MRHVAEVKICAAISRPAKASERVRRNAAIVETFACLAGAVPAVEAWYVMQVQVLAPVSAAAVLSRAMPVLQGVIAVPDHPASTMYAWFPIPVQEKSMPVHLPASAQHLHFHPLLLRSAAVVWFKKIVVM